MEGSVDVAHHIWEQQCLIARQHKSKSGCVLGGFNILLEEGKIVLMILILSAIFICFRSNQ